jgi:hypothetical protein
MILRSGSLLLVLHPGVLGRCHPHPLAAAKENER